jgi:hypothetical protein
MNFLDNFIEITDNYQNQCQEILKQAKIRKLPSGKYRVLSEKGKNLGTYPSQAEAKKRLKQVEYFKYLDSIDKSNADDKKSKKVIDLSKLEDKSLSALMRELNKSADKEQIEEFLKTYKKHFDEAIKNKLKNPDQIAFDHAFINLNDLFELKLNQKLVKKAAQADLGNPINVGNYLANIVKFLLRRISVAKRIPATNRLKNKFLALNENELSQKKMPASSSLGQSITFVKTVLFNHDPKYIREVLNNLVKFL